ncbi:ABC transporter permease [Agromyces sp. Leaf222]|uniref:ABC transporter permease n=1 Tax=Agromyces sp. Leaf222 TaxID=1735688 RepID=UPI0006FCD178|nr:ABC transporter permease [Agromyces sp. Leaf222]KQM84141.1 sugar ABC transporter permease [Agromyces sp. Leaf222]
MTSVDLTGFQTPGRGRGILDVFNHGYLLRLLIRKGTATRYRNSVLGWTWSYVKPAAQFFIYYFVMGVVLQFHRDVENFAVYLFAGVVAINLFNEAFGNATHSIVDNRALVRKIYLPRELFPISTIIIAVIHFLPQVAILLLACILLGWTPTFLSIGAFLLGLIIILMVSLGLGLLFGALNVRYRDAQNFVEIIRMLSTWASPVLYTIAMVEKALPDWAFRIYMLNPLTTSVELFHYAFWAPTTSASDLSATLAPSIGTDILTSLGIGIAVIVIGQIVFRRFERSFAQDL